jgi:hypothetical protein
MSAFFRGITETVPSLFRGIFSERNSVPNPMYMSVLHQPVLQPELPLDVPVLQQPVLSLPWPYLYSRLY